MGHTEVIIKKLKDFITGKKFHAGRLPTVRDLAEMFGTSKDTITLALTVLSYEGLVVIKPKAGVFLADNVWQTFYPEIVEWNTLIEKNPHVLMSNNMYDNGLNFMTRPLGMLNMHDGRINKSLILQAIANASERIRSSDILSGRHYMGIESLRVSICRHMARHNTFVRPEQIIVTLGYVNTLSIIQSAFLRNGTDFIYTYPNWLRDNMWKSDGINPIPIPFDTYGPDMDAMLIALSKSSPNRMLYLTPTYNIANGITTTRERKSEIVKVANKSKTPIIEMERFIDLHSNPSPTMMSMDKTHSVIYVGSFSDMLPSGINLSWIAAPEFLVERLMDVQFKYNMPAAVFDQLVLDDLLSTGMYYRYMDSFQDELAKSTVSAHAVLNKHMPDLAEWDENGHPLTFWVKLNKKVSSRFLLNNYVPPGTFFGVEPYYTCISKSGFLDEEFDTRISMLAANLREL